MTRTTSIPLAEFARREGKSYQTIRDKVARGTIKGEQVKGTWFVIVEDSIQVEDTQNTQSQELKAPDKPFGDMIFQALSTLNDMESTRSVEVGRLQDQLARLHDQIQAVHRDRTEEVKTLHAQIQTDQLAHRDEIAKIHKAQKWHLPAVAIALLAVGSLGLWSGWHHRGQMAQESMENHKAEVIRLAEWHQQEVARLRQALTEAQEQAKNRLGEIEPMEWQKAILGGNQILD